MAPTGAPRGRGRERRLTAARLELELADELDADRADPDEAELDAPWPVALDGPGVDPPQPAAARTSSVDAARTRRWQRRGRGTVAQHTRAG
ncbi:MAG: hypothetical protein ACXVUX_05310 [Solirubrobacteraceae bacterium]